MRRDGLSRQSLGRCFPGRGNRAAPALKKGASQKQAGKHEETPTLRGKGRSMARRDQSLGQWTPCDEGLGWGQPKEGTGLGRSHHTASTRLLCQLLERMCRCSVV